MGREKNPNIEKAHKLYVSGKLLVEISKELGVPEGTIRSWKNRYKWDNATDKKTNNYKCNVAKDEAKNIQKDEDSKIIPTLYTSKNKAINYDKNQVKIKKKKRGAPKGNKNAVGNKGGTGAPRGNQNGVITGERQTIFFEHTLSEEEKGLIKDIETFDLVKSMEENLKLWTLREYRILLRIKELQNKPGGMSVSKLSKTIGELQNDLVGNQKHNLSETEFVSTETDILKLEEALTRVQKGKANAAIALHKAKMEQAKLQIEIERLKVYKQKASGKINLNDIFDIEDFDINM